MSLCFLHSLCLSLSHSPYLTTSFTHSEWHNNCSHYNVLFFVAKRYLFHAWRHALTRVHSVARKMVKLSDDMRIFSCNSQYMAIETIAENAWRTWDPDRTYNVCVCVWIIYIAHLVLASYFLFIRPKFIVYTLIFIEMRQSRHGESHTSHKFRIQCAYLRYLWVCVCVCLHVTHLDIANSTNGRSDTQISLREKSKWSSDDGGGGGKVD